MPNILCLGEGYLQYGYFLLMQHFANTFQLGARGPKCVVDKATPTKAYQRPQGWQLYVTMQWGPLFMGPMH